METNYKHKFRISLKLLEVMSKIFWTNLKENKLRRLSITFFKSAPKIYNCEKLKNKVRAYRDSLLILKSKKVKSLKVISKKQDLH
jgi:hypothetical protein